MTLAAGVVWEGLRNDGIKGKRKSWFGIDNGIGKGSKADATQRR